MAGDSIRMEHELPEKPEFLEIMALTGMSDEAVFFKLFRLWTFFDTNTVDGVATGVSRRALALRCGTSDAFIDALESVGWLRMDGEWPAIDMKKIVSRWGSKRKRRESARARKAKWRESRADGRLGDDLGDELARPQLVSDGVTSASSMRVTSAPTRSNDLTTTRSNDHTTSTTPSESVSFSLNGNSTCSEPGKPASQPSPELLRFECVGTGAKAWSLTQAQVDRWSQDFPALDVLYQARAARAWLEANPSKRKTAKGMPRFLVAWFTRQNDRGHVNGHATNGSSPKPEPRERTEEERRREHALWRKGFDGDGC